MKSTALLRLLSLLLGSLLCIGLLTASVTQEVPLGSLHGVVTMKENGKLLPNASVSLQYVGGGSDDVAKQWHSYETKADGSFDSNRIPAGVYTIEVTARAHSAKRRSIIVEEGKNLDLKLVLEPKEPDLELYASQRVFTPGEKASFEIHCFDRAEKAIIHYYRLDLGKIVQKGGLSTLLYSFSRPGNEGGSDPSKSSTMSDQFDKPLTGKDIEGVFTGPVILPTLEEGFYYVRCEVGKQSKATYLNISTIGLVTKTSGSDAVCYVTDLITGEPVAGAAIRAPGGTGLKQIASTDRSGLAKVTVTTSTLKKALLFASHGKSQAVVDFDNESGQDKHAARIFMYADRPIYRPGDKVQFKGIIRKLQGLTYSLPAPGQVKIEIRDTDETAVQKFSLPVSAKGTFNGSFTSNSEDKPGVYSIAASYPGGEFIYFVNLAAYRKPEFSIKVTPNKKYFVYGDKASATVKAEYYFGGPVVGASVEAYVSRRPHYSYPADLDEDYAADESGSYSGTEFVGEYSEKVDVTTNEKGEAVIEFNTKSEGDTGIPDFDFDYTVNASITDASNKYFDGTGEVTVVRGEVSADLEVDHNIAEPGETISAEVTVKTQDGSPVAGKDVSIVVGNEVWDDNKSTFVVKQTLTGRTDPKGIAVLPLKVSEEGSLVLKATVKDDAGRPVLSSSYVYVEGDSIYGPPAAKFTVTLDRKSYKTGDKCKVLIETDKPGGSALITVQAEKVLASYVVKLDKRATVLTIPVQHDYAPNVWVSAVSIKSKRLLEAQSRLVVNVKDHDLTIAVTPDRADYKPGDVANLTIKTTDADGKPVPADLSIGVVDESLYAIRPDSTNIKKGFYPMRGDYVRTNYSFEEIYLDGGDKAGGNIPVRSKFLDVADWKPSVSTDASGVAHTSIKLPDNLTSWRATAVGVTDATQVGLTHVNFRARKSLMMRLELPSFLVQQDTQRITAIVTNDTGKDQDVNVRLEAQGVKVNGEMAQKIHVSATKPQAITWEVLTPDSGAATFTAYAWIDSEIRDAEERHVTIAPHGRLTTESHSGEVRGDQTFTFNVSPTADRNTGRLLLTISPSVGACIYQALDDLIDFPYGCTEQTMSRFLPTVVLSKTLKDLNMRFDREAQVPEMVSNGFARLAKMQHSNGAWGWWEYDEADMFMTAYVLDGLSRAKAAGYHSDKIDVEKALEWAKKQIKETPKDFQVRDFLYLCYAVAASGGKDDAKEAIALAKPTVGSDFALLAMIHGVLGDTAGRDQDLARLHDLMKVEGDVAHFEGKTWDYGVEADSFPLVALTTLTPQDPFIPKIVRYMMITRSGDSWHSTRDSSLVIIGLTQYMQFTRDAGKPVDIDVVVNGGAAKHLHFDPTQPFTPNLKLTIPMSELKPGENKVEFHRTGSDGICYFSTELKQIDVAEKLLPLRDTIGLSISRSYYLLEPQRLENGNMELRPSKRSIDEARSGDLIRVELTINSNVDREFIMIEDPIPSGCRITEREYIDENEEWSYWWSQTIVRDDKAAFFMRNLPKGTQKLTYTMRAEQIGLGHALPTTLSNMYDPAQTASGGESLLKVRE